MPTARAGTEEEIANLALGHIKQPPIATLSDDNNRARAVKQFFALARDATLRLRWWNFATAWAQLAQLANVTPVGPFNIVCALPPDCLLVRFVQNSDVNDWEIQAYKPPSPGTEANVLATKLPPPLICFTRLISNPALWTPDFCVALSFQLAAFAGPQMGAAVARIEAAQAKAESWREEAARVDAREKSEEIVDKYTSWVTSRSLGGAFRRYR